MVVIVIISMQLTDGAGSVKRLMDYSNNLS